MLRPQMASSAMNVLRRGMILDTRLTNYWNYKMDKLVKNEKVEWVVDPKDLADMIDKFKKVNPHYKRLFGIKAQREAVERLIIHHGYDKVETAIKFVAMANQMPYAPVITTPVELEFKYAKLQAFFMQEQNKKFLKGKQIIE